MVLRPEVKSASHCLKLCDSIVLVLKLAMPIVKYAGTQTVVVVVVPFVTPLVPPTVL